MNPEKELRLAYGMAIILFVVGVFCFAAFSAKPPSDSPLRIMHQTGAGKVLFSHTLHAEDYGASCGDCHHHAPDAKKVPKSCGACHDLPKDGSAPKACGKCHNPDSDYGDLPDVYETGGVMNNADAFHNQCGGCHEENGAGPEKASCSACHVM